LADVAGQREFVLPVAFATQGDLGASPVDVLEIEIHDLTPAQAEPEHPEHYGVVSKAQGRAPITTPQKIMHLCGLKKPWQGSKAPAGDRWSGRLEGEGDLAVNVEESQERSKGGDDLLCSSYAALLAFTLHKTRNVSGGQMVQLHGSVTRRVQETASHEHPILDAGTDEAALTHQVHAVSIQDLIHRRLRRGTDRIRHRLEPAQVGQNRHHPALCSPRCVSNTAPVREVTIDELAGQPSR
jgi:hypothetical protein